MSNIVQMSQYCVRRASECAPSQYEVPLSDVDTQIAHVAARFSRLHVDHRYREVAAQQLQNG